jgi:hypothetical protein
MAGNRHHLMHGPCTREREHELAPDICLCSCGSKNGKTSVSYAALFDMIDIWICRE